jgi:hypothetical protein
MKHVLNANCVRLALIVVLAGVAALVVGENRASAQQGPYITQASERLGKLVDKGNKNGFTLQKNSFSIGGGWLKKSKEWVPIYSVELKAGKEYRFLAAGDDDAKDVDLRVMSPKGNQVAIDADVDRDAIVNFTPKVSGRYTVEIRLYSSRDDLDAVVLSVMMSAK